MKYPVIYIKGKGSHTARFSEMVEGRMYVVGDIDSAMRTLTSLRTDHAFILYEQRDPAADLANILFFFFCIFLLSMCFYV